jgi:hypothetical protein
MGIKRRTRKKKKKLGGEMRKSVDKSLLADVERGVKRPVREHVDRVLHPIEDGLDRELGVRRRRRRHTT